MLSVSEQKYSHNFLDWIKNVQANGLTALELDVQNCETAADCLKLLTEDAHLILMNFSELMSNEEKLVIGKIREFCQRHQIINVKSEKELQLALGMMQKGFWDYIRPEEKQLRA